MHRKHFKGHYVDHRRSGKQFFKIKNVDVASARKTVWNGIPVSNFMLDEDLCIADIVETEMS